MDATIYIPTEAAGTRLQIAPGSGIVGLSRDNGGVLLYFEGNLHNAENLRTYEERLACAAGRLFTRYPTVAKILLSREDVERELIAVGTIDRAYKIGFENADLRKRALAYGALDRHNG
jgi:hypothetical protein